MNFVSISDIHIRDSKDSRYWNFLSFLNSKDILETKNLILLGDVFDVLVGDFNEYTTEYSHFFEKINQLLSIGIQVYFIEGNHDFNCEENFLKTLNPSFHKNFHYRTSPFLLKRNGESWYIGHGDELDITNIKYIKYRRFIRSRIVKYFSKSFFSYKKVLKIKDDLSRKSKDIQRNFNEEVERSKFRGFAGRVLATGVDKVVLGHSHVLENEKQYFNNGFFPETHKYFLANDNFIGLKSIEEES